MDLDTALKGMFDAENALRSREGVHNPTFMSEQMMRLSQYVGAVEEHLADYERELEFQEGTLLKRYMIDNKVKVTEAQRLIDIDIAERKGQIKYLTRIVKSAWSQVGVIQSRINHLIREAQATNL
jgi:hypothetical protein